ncbi:MAG: TonB family protein [Luteimonas sp.]
MNRPPEEPVADTPPRKGANPLLWLLVLVALLAFGWYFYNRRASEATQPMGTPATGTTAITTPPEQRAVERPRPQQSPPSERAKPARQAMADRDPTPIARVQPAYPPEALRVREEGSVLVRATIDAGGAPTNVEIARRSGSRELDRAALDAVRQWRFQPAIKSGKAVTATVEVPIEFKLDQQ